jgi:aconitate hydratase A / 2-methylisocitrate dehydratase
VKDSFRCRSTLAVNGRSYEYARLIGLEGRGVELARLPYSIRILLENLLRNEDGLVVKAEDIEAVARWDPKAEPRTEIAFTPARVLLQDFTGVPAVVDLAAMRDAMARMGGNPERINPRQPVELVIDHSVQVDAFGSSQALRINSDLEFARNRERYLFLRWGQQAFSNFEVVPPDTGIVHQVNLEYLARVVMIEAPKDEGAAGEGAAAAAGARWAIPDTLVGTDSHTTMINGLGVLGWGVGGIEAEAAMLGQPVSMLLPQVVGFGLRGELPEGATATDLVLRVTELLRKQGVVGKFVEFYGPGVVNLSLADRATIANMAPEYGATCGIFPVDQETLAYLRFSGRSEEQVALVEAYMKAQGLFHTPASPVAAYTETLELDLGTVVPSLAGPKRPQDRVPLPDVGRTFREALAGMQVGVQGPKPRPETIGRLESEGGGQVAVAVAEAVSPDGAHVELDGVSCRLKHGSVVIAAITSCTNTSNPSVMLAAGLLAKKALARGLARQPWVKTSLAPGSKVVTDYLRAAGLAEALEKLGFFTVGYGCTTCIGNSGPLPEPISAAIEEHGLVVAAVLSGNRNFEGRIHAQVRANYLASPPLVVAYAIAGRVDFDPTSEPLGKGKDGKPVFLREIWPTQREVRDAMREFVRAEQFQRNYANVFLGDEHWRALEVPKGPTYAWDPDSTYVKRAPYFDDFTAQTPRFRDIRGARVLAMLGDSVTTDHISPAGSIKPASPAGQYLIRSGVAAPDFNSYGARRGNHEVMVRGTFANVRLRNKLVPGVEGGETVLLPEEKPLSIFDAAMEYSRRGTPLVLLAGKEYGSGSSRDWAAKGPYLLGVRAVIAESFERIHRSNLVGMNVIPLQFQGGMSAESLGLTGREEFDFAGLAEYLGGSFQPGRLVQVRAKPAGGKASEFRVLLRIDTPQEFQYVKHGGILQFVLRKLFAEAR